MHVDLRSLVYFNHFALAIYSLKFNIVTYADTFGWGMLETVKITFLKVSQHFKKPTTLYNLCHHPGVDVTTHICAHLGSHKYPLQTCSGICGISVIIGASLCRTGVYGLLLPNSQIPTNEIAYCYSKLLRRVIMQWIMKGKIDVNMLVKKPNINIPRNNYHSVTTSTYNSNNNKHTTSISSPNNSKKIRKADCKNVNQDRKKSKVDTYILPFKIMRNTETPSYLIMETADLNKPIIL